MDARFVRQGGMSCLRLRAVSFRAACHGLAGKCYALTKTLVWGVAKIYPNVLNKREKEPELYDAIKEVAPEWWGEDAQVTLNKDLNQVLYSAVQGNQATKK